MTAQYDLMIANKLNEEFADKEGAMIQMSLW